jgi:hypothetical protein
MSGAVPDRAEKASSAWPRREAQIEVLSSARPDSPLQPLGPATPRGPDPRPPNFLLSFLLLFLLSLPSNIPPPDSPPHPTAAGLAPASRRRRGRRTPPPPRPAHTTAAESGAERSSRGRRADRRLPRENSASGQGRPPAGPSSAEDLADLAEARVAAHLTGGGGLSRRRRRRRPRRLCQGPDCFSAFYVGTRLLSLLYLGT